MIDNFALALSHGLLILAAWRLLSRPDLDDDGAQPADAGGWRPLLETPFRKPKATPPKSTPPKSTPGDRGSA